MWMCDWGCGNPLLNDRVGHRLEWRRFIGSWNLTCADILPFGCRNHSGRVRTKTVKKASRLIIER